MSSAQLYGAYCLGCHEADGRGSGLRKAAPTIPDFTDPKWQTSHNDAEIGTAIREGKGKIMIPMKDRLAAPDVAQVIAYVRAFKGAAQVAEVIPVPPPIRPPDKPLVKPVPAAPPVRTTEGPAVAELAERRRVTNLLYQQYCLACHGTDGRATAMRASMPAIPDFASRAFQESRESPQLSVSVLDGKGTLMPPFRGRVQEGQVPDLVAYVRAFGPARAAGAETAPAPTDFEEQFRRLEQQWESLHKQLEDLSKKPPKR
jgi:mono/diheme cytochrome c family protein